LNNLIERLEVAHVSFPTTLVCLTRFYQWRRTSQRSVTVLTHVSWKPLTCREIAASLIMVIFGSDCKVVCGTS